MEENKGRKVKKIKFPNGETFTLLPDAVQEKYSVSVGTDKEGKPYEVLIGQRSDGKKWVEKDPTLLKRFGINVNKTSRTKSSTKEK